MTGAVEILTFGCRLNGVESDRMRELANGAGERNLTIVNTCAVTAEAVRQARQAIRRIGRETPDRRILVTGCAAEVDPASFSALPGVDRIHPNAEKSQAASWGLDGASVLGEDRSASRQTRGFVEVQNGCDHRCSFCIIPFGRGASRSTSPEAVISRVRALVAEGVQEIVFTGVDLTSYSQGGDRMTLGGLARRVLDAVPDLPRLRLSSLDCLEIDSDLLDLLADEPRFMPHLHLSLQAGSDLILKRMKRRHLRQEAVDFCRQARALRPDVAFGADFIAGFPTETEALFRETLTLIDECDIAYVHSFPYSSRPGTPAARMPPVAPAEVKERAARLRQHAAERLSRHLDRRLGRALSVLTERSGLGHAEDFTAVRFAQGIEPGSLRRVTARRHDGRSLVVDPAADAKTSETLSQDSGGG